MLIAKHLILTQNNIWKQLSKVARNNNHIIQLTGTL